MRGCIHRVFSIRGENSRIWYANVAAAGRNSRSARPRWLDTDDAKEETEGISTHAATAPSTLRDGICASESESTTVRRAISLIIGLLLVAVAGAGVASAQPAEPQPDCEYFDETSHNLCEPFTSYWNANGGLPVFGYPITEAANELNLDLNQEFLTQYFERERMEHHPENAGTPYEVLLGRLGNEVLLEMGRNWFTFPQADPSAEHYFPETGHAIDPAFYEYWSSNGLDLGDE